MTICRKSSVSNLHVFALAWLRHACNVPSEIPSSFDNCPMAILFGGSIRCSIAALRSCEYPTSSSYPTHLKIKGKVERRTTSLT